LTPWSSRAGSTRCRTCAATSWRLGRPRRHDKRQNDAALKSGEDRLFSSYQVAPGLQLWIITEWDRSVTTLLLPSEY
jgi:hypothetical protein